MGPIPPEWVTVAKPSLPPLQVGFVPVTVSIVIGVAVSSTVTLSIIIQPSASVTLTV